jgi:large subunit ribosomal protein L30
MAKLRITYRKSSIGFSKDQKATVRSLGLRKLNSVVIQEDTPAVRGMIFKVKHLLHVEEVDGDVQPEQRSAAPTTVVRAKEPGASAGQSSQLSSATSTTSTTRQASSASEPAAQVGTASSEPVRE